MKVLNVSSSCIFLLVVIHSWNVALAGEFRCPAEFSQDQLTDIIRKARTTRTDLPPLITGRVAVSKIEGGCSYLYLEMMLPASTGTWNYFEIDALGSVMEWGREEKGTTKYHPDNHEQFIDKGEVGTLP